MVSELSLTVPITNSLAFLFTVLGEWWADGRVISRGLYTFISKEIASTKIDRYLDWHDSRTCWNSSLRACKDVIAIAILYGLCIPQADSAPHYGDPHGI